MRLPFEAEAAAEFEEAVAWYEREREGLGAMFVSEVRRAIDRAADLPRSGPCVGDTYLVITGLVAGQRAVLAVAHTRRRLGYWRERLR
jgi:toxin ParE1/3/4